MTKEDIIDQINKSYNEYKGINEAIDDAAYYIHQLHLKDLENIFNNIIRFEVINHKRKDIEIGKILTHYSPIKAYLQDDNKTLKIFL